MSLCLLTEETYPYHVGGVSTWTHALLQGLSDVPVLLVPLYAGQSPGAPLLDLPAHVTAHPPLRVPDTLAPDAIADWCRTVAPTLPAMDLVHALTAGVAGQLGRRLQTERGLPFLVTEHGIGWHELQHGAGETETGYRPEGAAPCAADAALERAVRDLQHHARAVYAAADVLTTVAWANQEKQYALGADPASCHVVPNGVSVPNRPPDDPTGPFHVGLVGRVTPLKDIVTFLHACALVHEVLPTARFSVVGPPSDPAYAARCHALAHRLDLDDAVTFVENARTMTPWYRRFHAVALTSRSEAQPLALLEAMAQARPVVATDVGDCRRLIDDPDDNFGSAGAVCPVGNARAFADALLTLAREPNLGRTRGRVGWTRVRRSYQRDASIAAYRRLYHSLRSSRPVASASSYA
jgi:glycosyltransferase involved in cell wall biosynthesis